MAINSLSNFGTPAINGYRSAAWQPIMLNRFRVTFYFDALSPVDLTRQCKSVGQPKRSFEEIKLWTYTQPTYVINRPEWQTIKISFYDDIANSVMTIVEQQMSRQYSFSDQTYSRAGENYKFDFDVDLLAGGATAGGGGFDPNILRKWSYAGCLFTENDYSELDVSKSAEAGDISVTVRFDNAIGFDENGNQMGTFDHTAEINSQSGFLTTLSSGGTGVSLFDATTSSGNNFSATLTF